MCVSQIWRSLLDSINRNGIAGSDEKHEAIIHFKTTAKHWHGNLD